jgi:hypothetical protein
MSRAPTDAPVGSVRDVLVIPTTYIEGGYPDEQPLGMNGSSSATI